MTSLNSISNNVYPPDPSIIVPELIRDLQAYLSDPSVANANTLLKLLTENGGEANVDAALKALGYSYQPGDTDPSSEVHGLINLLKFIVQNPTDHQWAVEASYNEVGQISRWAGYTEIVDPKTGIVTLHMDDQAVTDRDILALLKKFEQDPTDPKVLSELNWILTSTGYVRDLEAFSKDPKIKELIQNAQSVLAAMADSGSGISKNSEIDMLKSIVNEILNGQG